MGWVKTYMTYIHKPQLNLKLFIQSMYKMCITSAIGMLSISVYIFCFIISKLVTSAYLSLSEMYAEYVSK